MGDFNKSVDPKPINGRLLVRMVGNSSKTTGGLFIPATAVSRPIHGVVEATSEGYYEGGVWRRHAVHIGDVVIFKSMDGFDLELDDDDYRIIHENEVVAVLQGVNYGEEG